LQIGGLSSEPNRRCSFKDYDFLRSISEAIMYLVMTRLMLKRLDKVGHLPALI
jgi:hypothetical protein